MPEILIKKYPNRRLYNTQISSYISTSDIVDLIKNNHFFKVVDSKTNKDITNSILTQIIIDQELKFYQLLPSQVLKNIISYHSQVNTTMVPPHFTYFIDLFNSQAANKNNSGNIIENSLNMIYKSFGLSWPHK